MSTQVYQTKFVDEVISVDVDMLSRLKVGEAISTSAAAISVVSGVDAFPNLLLVGLPTNSGSIVTQQVQGGVPGVIYLLEISIRTSLSNIYVNQAKIAVLSSNAGTPA